jgi:hypothetical protein
VSTPFASPLAPSNLSPNILKELKASMCLCAILSSYNNIQFFIKILAQNVWPLQNFEMVCELLQWTKSKVLVFFPRI